MKDKLPSIWIAGIAFAMLVTCFQFVAHSE